ncbi:unnamed protein product [Tetraodon nigroviridis]|uniref:(spotted green pufferfish) hypothetical protein n=1 Tax=Tetraodon nigroviridis TaxID=99883 RepID=Q4RKL9_TETNG|nr:unnamed protein product [Tetraodon nigroviridis]
MMSLNSKQAFAMAHTSLPEPKYSLHSSYVCILFAIAEQYIRRLG